MTDFTLDEPLALLAEAFGQEQEGAAHIRIDAEDSATTIAASAPVIAAFAASPAEASAYTFLAD